MHNEARAQRPVEASFRSHGSLIRSQCLSFIIMLLHYEAKTGLVHPSLLELHCLERAPASQCQHRFDVLDSEAADSRVQKVSAGRFQMSVSVLLQ